jgi:uncharacterized protein YfaP (DUF2135 family)
MLKNQRGHNTVTSEASGTLVVVGKSLILMVAGGDSNSRPWGYESHGMPKRN